VMLETQRRDPSARTSPPQVAGGGRI
jgi:hypothetical protein